MPEYIDREKAIDYFSGDGAQFVYGENVCKAIISRLKTFENEDVVPVVRCKDCVFATDRCVYTKGRGGNLLLCEIFENYTMPDDFCSCGERKS